MNVKGNGHEERSEAHDDHLLACCLSECLCPADLSRVTLHFEVFVASVGNVSLALVLEKCFRIVRRDASYLVSNAGWSITHPLSPTESLPNHIPSP